MNCRRGSACGQDHDRQPDLCSRDWTSTGHDPRKPDLSGADLLGILNGIDEASWDPKKIRSPRSIHPDQSGKSRKESLLAEMNLPVNPDSPSEGFPPVPAKGSICSSVPPRCCPNLKPISSFWAAGQKKRKMPFANWQVSSLTG